MTSARFADKIRISAAKYNARLIFVSCASFLFVPIENGRDVKWKAISAHYCHSKKSITESCNAFLGLYVYVCALASSTCVCVFVYVYST